MTLKLLLQFKFYYPTVAGNITITVQYASVLNGEGGIEAGIA
jgi:hypothetical protein